MKSKRITAMLLLFFVVSVFSGTGLAPAQAATIPNDITGSWAFSQISYLVELGIVTGYPDGTFRPNNPVTRAEFISMMNRAFGFQTTVTINYTDVKPGDWFYEEIAKAKAAGYIAGFIDGTMRPDNYISRQEAAAVVARAANLDATNGGELTFIDAASIPSWSRDYIAAMVKAGYLSGYPDGTFRPLISISRSEAAVIIFESLGTRVSGVALNRSTATLTEGRTLTLLATVEPAEAINKKVTWTSSDPDVASVNSSGKVTAKKRGAVTITVKTDEGGYTDTCTINVVSRKANLDMPATLDLYLDGNDQKTMIVYLDGEDTDIQDIEVEIDGDDVINVDHEFAESYVTISVEGVDEGESEINLTVIADDGDRYRADCDVTVSAEADADKLVMPEMLNLYLGGNDDKTMMVYLDGATSDIDQIAWAATGDDIFDVDYYYGSAYVALTVDGNKEGDSTLNLTVTTEDGDKYSADCFVTVTDVDEFGMGRNDFDFSDAFINMNTNDEETIKAYIPDGYDTADVDQVDWDSDDANVADIKDFDDSNQDYIVLTVESDEEGECVIIVYFTIDDEVYSAELEVMVESTNGGEELTIYDDEMTLAPDEQDTVRVYLPLGYTMDDAGDISWESDDPAVADAIDYDFDSDNRYATFTAEAYDVGECIITFYMTVGGDELDVDLFVTVEE